MAQHPTEQELLFKEVKQHLESKKVSSKAGSGKSRITLEMLKDMPYLDAVVFESLRLFPPVPSDFKQAARDVLLPNGMKLKKDMIISFEP